MWRKGSREGTAVFFYRHLKAAGGSGCEGGHMEKWLAEEDKPQKGIYSKLLQKCDGAFWIYFIPDVLF